MESDWAAQNKWEAYYMCVASTEQSLVDRDRGLSSPRAGRTCGFGKQKRGGGLVNIIQ